MISTLLFSFISEIYLSLSILIFLLFNLMALNVAKFNYPVSKLENLSLVIISLLLLVHFVKIEGYAFNSSFIINVINIYLKIVWLVFCIFSFIVICRSSIIRKLNFFGLLVLYYVSARPHKFYVGTINFLWIN